MDKQTVTEMMKKLFSCARYAVFTVMLLSICMSCNNDIFVENMEWNDSDTLKGEVEGDGGKVTFKIPTKNLLRVSIDLYGGKDPYKYYDKAGNEISSDTPASGLAKIVGDFPLAYYEVVLDGGELTVNSLERCANNYASLSIRLEYTYKVRFIQVSILKGEPLQYVETIYDEEPEVDDNADNDVKKITFTNYGPIEQTIEIMPFLGSYNILWIGDVEDWASYLAVEMPILDYSGGEWTFKDKSVRLGDSEKWSPENYLSKVNVTVPANSRSEIITTLFYTKAEAGGKIKFRKPVSGKELTTPFTMKSLHPYKYDIEINEVK